MTDPEAPPPNRRNRRRWWFVLVATTAILVLTFGLRANRTNGIEYVEVPLDSNAYVRIGVPRGAKQTWTKKRLRDGTITFDSEYGSREKYPWLTSFLRAMGIQFEHADFIACNVIEFPVTTGAASEMDFDVNGTAVHAVPRTFRNLYRKSMVLITHAGSFAPHPLGDTKHPWIEKHRHELVRLRYRQDSGPKEWK